MTRMLSLSCSVARLHSGFGSTARASLAPIARVLSTAPLQEHQQPGIGPADYRHKSNLISLPPHLKTALTSLLSPTPTPTSDSTSSPANPPPITGPRIRSASLRIFDSLRSTTGTVNSSRAAAPPKIPSLANPDRHLSPHHIAYDHDTSLAYLAARFPACFTGIKRVLGEAVSKMGDTSPMSVLDVGTGPGTAVWALRAVEDEMAGDADKVVRAKVTAVDVNQNMLSVAKQLASAGNMQGNVEWVEYMPASLSASYDMSIAAYSMWRLTDNMLVLVDRGTPHGYQRMLEARDWFISQSNAAKQGDPKATILAPCPHMAKCPLAGNGRDWCHFSQRMERPTETVRILSRQLSRSTHKHAKSNLEDVKFSYLIIQKQSAVVAPESPLASSTWPRVLSVPLKRGGHVLVDVCTPRGTADRMIVTKSLGKDTYKAARKLGWGDQWPFAAKVYVPGRGMGRVDHGRGRGVLFAAGPATGSRLTLVEQPRAAAVATALAHPRAETAALEPPAEPRATRGGRAARGSKKPVSPFATLLAQQQQQQSGHNPKDD
ncbi:mitochondrial small ribosomal subunit Rsm22-domain-containing protein [Catenaria anguillulae PL171]|uniref:Mitochondrial small ribosomal subunit Rsm22-domain-containing protein n=1 Tax=Catenaria anguillulae PL171 TaxID=765915 RepID=A0A1Y2HY32_9FUNG|nr:mitochondrial small ribosomal subunit Rsm22-domain-containing protein [Catenaria anguillulae PL171]